MVSKQSRQTQQQQGGVKKAIMVSCLWINYKYQIQIHILMNKLIKTKKRNKSTVGLKHCNKTGQITEYS